MNHKAGERVEYVVTFLEMDLRPAYPRPHLPAGPVSALIAAAPGASSARKPSRSRSTARSGATTNGPTSTGSRRRSSRPSCTTPR